MALPSVGQANYPSSTELLNQVLSDLRYSYAIDGLECNLLEGGDHWKRAEVFCRRAAIAIANNKLSLANFSPLSAEGDDLVSLAGVFGVVPRVAVGAVGYLRCYGTAAAVIPFPDGFQATAPDGYKYQVSGAQTVTLVGATDAAGTAPTVLVRAVGVGEETNQDATTSITWDLGTFGALKAEAKVDTGGLEDGTDEDDDDDLRDRLLRKLKSPGVGGNFSQVADWAEESTAAVEVAYVYPAVRGPGTLDVVVTAAGGDRTLSSATVATVAAYVAAQMPGFCDINTTTVNAQAVDVVLNATLPLPQNAGGSGGGWLDAAPWPSTADTPLAKVTAVAGSTITVNSTSADPPVVGKRFALWDPDEEAMTQLTIATVGGVSGAYVITPAEPLPSWVVTGMYCSAAAGNLDTYAGEFLAQMLRLGPGEKTADTAILPRGRRNPPPDVSNPSALTTLQLSAITSAHSEVLNLEYAARYDTGTTTARTSPSLPASTANAPRILTLNHLSFRRQA